MKKSILTLLLLAPAIFLFAQKIGLSRVEPPNWWVGMKNPNVQLLIYGENIAKTDVVINSDKVRYISSTRVKNPNYVFLDLEILPTATAGSFDISFQLAGKEKAKYTYRLENRTPRKRGFSPADLVYLLMPDRFANGDPANDNFPGVRQTTDRANADGRHGGDIKGISQHLDYIQSLGMTAIWFNPMVENDIPIYAYHGYGATDFYKVDPRFGTQAELLKLVDDMHARDLKFIQDMVFNHCATDHWWMRDLPSDDWINTSKDFKTSYRAEVIADPYASESDKFRFSSGWFVENMPDLNQHNPLMANYLIQNSIWWTELSKLDGIRMDTQAYPYPDFMAAWATRIKDEFPDITLLGETWMAYIPFTAYFSGNSPVAGSYNSHLDCVTDFPLRYAFEDAFNEEDGWKVGTARFYYTFAQDFLYGNAYNNVTFLDNHDINRIFSVMKENVKSFKMGIAILLTARGIPVWYYGTEYHSSGWEHDGHGAIRKDFPGGWAGDAVNVFEQKGMKDTEKEVFEYTKRLGNWRKTNTAVQTGKFLHFVPENSVYVYFRYTETSAVMVVVNNHNIEERKFDGTRFNEILKNYKSATNIETGKKQSDLKSFTVPAKSVTIYELGK